MFSKLFSTIFLAHTLFSLTSAAQVDLSTVGPLTPLSSKSKICNVLDYGGVADNSTDIGPAITLAFSSCASTGNATLYIPPGSYSRTPPPPNISSQTYNRSQNRRNAQKRLCLRPPNRRPHHLDLRRHFQRKRLRPRIRHRHRSLFFQLPRRNKRTRLPHTPLLVRTKRASIPVYLLHVDIHPRYHIR